MAAATLTSQTWGRCDGYAKTTFSTTLASTATAGVTVPLGWSQLDHVSIKLKNATSQVGEVSYGYTGGILTLYGNTTAMDSAEVTVTCWGKD